MVEKSDERNARMMLLPDHVNGNVRVVRRAPGALTKIRKTRVGPRMRRMTMAGPLSAANTKA